MLKPSITLMILAVLLGGTCTGLAEPFDCGGTDAFYDRHMYTTYGDLYEHRYRRDIFMELQRAKEDREMAELIKKFPSNDPLQSKLSRRMDAINSTNFTANTNVAPMEIVPGLSGKP